MAEKDRDLGTGNADLLKKIRNRYRYAADKWREIREEGRKNIQYVSGDPWDDADKQVRQGRPTVCPDELNQYVNQVVNTARQNPRGIKIDPAGDGASEELAEYRENRIRAIEYACNASQAYLNGLQAVVERNMGFWKVSRQYVSDQTDEQEILVLPIMNPDSVLIDPDYKELDGSDIKWAFELERVPLTEFENDYPNAEKVSFSASDFGDDADSWLDEKTILVCVYSEVVMEEKIVGPSKRKVKRRVGVQQYRTNGVEILQKPDRQPGAFIPIVPVFGKELWLDDRRLLLSLVSLARDPQKALAYVMSSMLENVGQLPRTSFIGAVGQFKTDKDAWDTSNTQFHPYLQYDMVIDSETGQPMAPPQRQQLTPDFQAYSIGADVCRRAIMSAMGLQVLPTPMQRANQKSGIAVDKIESQQAIGSYHLIDSYERAIKLTGRIINDWLSLVDVGEIEKPVRLADGKHKIQRVNQTVQDGNDVYNINIQEDLGRYQVTISSGPSSDSQRQAGSDFADTLVTNLPTLPLAPPQAAELLGLAIKLKQLGPLGDQMVDIISPQNAQMGQQMGMLQQQYGAMQQQFQKMAAELQSLKLQQQAKLIDRQGQLEVEKLRAATDLAVAEMNASKDTREAIAQQDIQTYKLLHESAHDRASQAADHAHDRQMAAQQAQQQMIQAQNNQAAANQPAEAPAQVQ